MLTGIWLLATDATKHLHPEFITNVSRTSKATSLKHGVTDGESLPVGLLLIIYLGPQPFHTVKNLVE